MIGTVLRAAAVLAVVAGAAAIVAAFVTGTLWLVYASLLLLVLAIPMLVGAVVAGAR